MFFNTGRRILRTVIFLLLFFTSAAVVFPVNPFLGKEEQPGPKPPRQNTGQLPEGLRKQQEKWSGEISSFFRQMGENPSPGTLILLLGTAFLYGIVHAAGPGHRKTVVFSLFLGKRTRWWEPLTAGFLSGAVHAGTGAVLVLILAAISGKLLSGRVRNVSVYLEGGSYLVLSLVAAGFLVMKVIGFIKRKKADGEPDMPGKSLGVYGITASSSLFPCPVAVMIILFAVALDQVWLGIITVAALSAGMGLTITIAAFLAWTGRTQFFNRLEKNKKHIKTVSDFLESGTYMFLFLFSLWMVFPFLSSLFTLS